MSQMLKRVRQKGWRVAGFLGAVFGGLFLHSQRARTAGRERPVPPSNVWTVDSKFGALPVAAALATGGYFIVVAVDEAHRSAVDTIVAQHARSHPSLEYVIVDMDLARSLAAERGDVEPIPADAWGGVTAIVNAQVVWHRYFTGTDNISTHVHTAENTAIGIEALPAAEQTPVAAGILPPASDSTAF